MSMIYNFLQRRPFIITETEFNILCSSIMLNVVTIAKNKYCHDNIIMTDMDFQQCILEYKSGYSCPPIKSMLNEFLGLFAYFLLT